MANVQIFGVKNSQATRAAERFFIERRAVIHMVDLKKKALAAGEIKRFVERFGWNGMLDVEGKAYVEGGLKYLKLSEAELMQRIEREPSLLRLPLVRGGKLVSIGQDGNSIFLEKLMHAFDIFRRGNDPDIQAEQKCVGAREVLQFGVKHSIIEDALTRFLVQAEQRLQVLQVLLTAIRILQEG